ncbi:MAG: homocysteine biosynthesis protein, partial [Methanoregulaceae archaeon]|nr:homocysteine biosynthesis protein [Methanoregulaceae archaeon]
TQFNPSALRNEKGIPKRGAGTLAVIGDLKQMSPRWLVGTSMLGYGSTLTVGIGVPIPVLNEGILEHAAASDSDIQAAVIDYSDAYPNMKPDILGEVSYAQLKSGKITINGKEIPTASLSSYPRALEIAEVLKKWINTGKFMLTEAVMSLPGLNSGVTVRAVKERPLE